MKKPDSRKRTMSRAVEVFQPQPNMLYSLDVAAHLVLPAAPMAVFDCRIEARGATLATAQLTVYQP